MSIGNNVSFASFVSLVDANKGTSGSKFVKLQGVAGHSVCIKPSDDDTIFSWFRSSGQKVVNNQVRDAFLSSVLTRLNLSDASQLPAEIKKAMSLSDYNGSNGLASSLTGATGSSTTGKPLKLRTIRDVVAAVQKYETSNPVSGEHLRPEVLAKQQEKYETLANAGIEVFRIKKGLSEESVQGEYGLRAAYDKLADTYQRAFNEYLSEKISQGKPITENDLVGYAMKIKMEVNTSINNFSKGNLNNSKLQSNIGELFGSADARAYAARRCMTRNPAFASFLERYANDIPVLTTAAKTACQKEIDQLQSGDTGRQSKQVSNLKSLIGNELDILPKTLALYQQAKLGKGGVFSK